MLGAAEKMSPLERLPRPRKLGSSPGRGGRGGAGRRGGASSSAARHRIATWHRGCQGLCTRPQARLNPTTPSATPPSRGGSTRTHDGALVPGQPPAVLVPDPRLVLELGAAVVEHLRAGQAERHAASAGGAGGTQHCAYGDTLQSPPRHARGTALEARPHRMHTALHRDSAGSLHKRIDIIKQQGERALTASPSTLMPCACSAWTQPTSSASLPYLELRLYRSPGR